MTIKISKTDKYHLNFFHFNLEKSRLMATARNIIKEIKNRDCFMTCKPSNHSIWLFLFGTPIYHFSLTRISKGP